MTKQKIATEKAPMAIGPYSQGIIYDNLIFTSGQIPIDPSTGNIVEGDFIKQAYQVMENLKAILEAAGSSMNKVIKANVFLTDLSNFNEANKIYAEYIKDTFPSRSCIQVAGLPKNSLIEIEAIAYIEK